MPCIGALCGCVGTVCVYMCIVYGYCTHGVSTMSIVCGCHSVFLHYLVLVPENMFSSLAWEHEEGASPDV